MFHDMVPHLVVTGTDTNCSEVLKSEKMVFLEMKSSF